MNPDQAYVELVRLSREETVLSSCLELLQWDAEVCMPRGGVEHRAEQMALLAGLVHDRATDPRYDELLGAVEAASLVSDPESPQAVNVRELRRDFDRERRMPRRLVEEWARVTALALQAWAEARSKDDFKTFAPSIDRKGFRWLLGSADYDDLVAAHLGNAQSFKHVATVLRQRIEQMVGT